MVQGREDDDQAWIELFQALILNKITRVGGHPGIGLLELSRQMMLGIL